MNTDIDKINAIRDGMALIALNDDENKKWEIDNRPMIDVAFEMKQTDDRDALIVDLLIINADDGKKDLSFINNVINTKNLDIINEVVDKNKEDKDFSLNIMKSALRKEIPVKIFSSINYHNKNFVYDFNKELLDEISKVKQSSSDMDDKLLILLMTGKHENLTTNVVHNIAENGSVKSLKLLLSLQKVDVDLTNDNNENLWFKINGSSEEIERKKKLLTEANINPNLVNNQGLRAEEVNKELNLSAMKVRKNKM